MLTDVQVTRRTIGAEEFAAPGGEVGITRLALSNFRNYSSARLVLGKGPVVLTGANGAGKTNLLEALSFLAPGRGLRNARLSDIDRRALAATNTAGQNPAVSGWAVAAAVATRSGTVRIGTGREPAAGERRTVRIDGEAARNQGALSEHLGLVWLTPQMDRLFLDGPAGRRRFVDRLTVAIDPAHAGRVGAYEEALRQRAGLLRDGPCDPGWLSALESVMAAQGVAVAAARRETVQRLDAICAGTDGTFPRARLSLHGTVEGWLGEMPALAAEADFAAALAAARRGDALSGGAALGPHRSDLVVHLLPSGIPAEFGSTGEQKALLIAIVLAHAKLHTVLRGAPPLLLLDEVAAHLDSARRVSLFDVLRQLGSQTWLTGTEPVVFSPLRCHAQFLAVQNGTVTELAFDREL